MAVSDSGTSTNAPLPLHEETVRPEWIDYNGHLNDAYYFLVFSHATDALFDRIGLDAARRERDGTSVFTAEAHASYLREAHEGQRLRVTLQVLGCDAKRMHLFLAMHGDENGGRRPLATSEIMQIHVDTRARRAAPFAPDVLARLEAIRDAHAGLPWPEQAGRRIGLWRG